MGNNLAMAKNNTKSETLRFMATPTEASKLRRAAAEQETSMSEFVRSAAIVAADTTLNLPRKAEEP
jgi:uncharacterized protein (DUF1778 family)